MSFDKFIDAASSYAVPVGLAVALILAGSAKWDASAKQRPIAVINYTQLSDLYTGQIIGQTHSEDELRRLTEEYNIVARRVADEYAHRTGGLVIMNEAVVGGSENATDITMHVHRLAMARVERLRDADG